MKKYYKLFLLILLLFIILLPSTHLLAVDDITIIDTTSGCTLNGDCQISDLMQVVIRISTIMLVLSGSFSLLAFIYGGVLFLVSGGNSEVVGKAKRIIIGAVIGLIIVLGSYVIIDFVFKSLGIGIDWYKLNWFGG